MFLLIRCYLILRACVRSGTGILPVEKRLFEGPQLALETHGQDAHATTRRLLTRFLPENMRRILKIVLGILLIILGVLALLTPLTPGSWLALIGLEILGLRLLLERKLVYFVPHKYRRKVRNLLKRKLKKP